MIQTGFLRDPETVRRRALDDIYEGKRTEAFAWDFGETVGIDDDGVEAPAGLQTLQMRDTLENPDQRNWAAVAANIGMIPEASRSGVVVPIRTTANVWVQATATEVAACLGAMMARQVGRLARYGVLKKLDEAGENPDFTTGWP